MYPIVMVIIPIGLGVVPIWITRGITRISLLLLWVGIVVPMLVMPVGYLWGTRWVLLLLLGVVLLLIGLGVPLRIPLRVFIFVTE